MYMIVIVHLTSDIVELEKLSSVGLIRGARYHQR